MTSQQPLLAEYDDKLTPVDEQSDFFSHKDSNETHGGLLSSVNKSGSSTDEFHPSSYERGFITSANVGIFLCSLGILFNVSLFVVLCRSRRLRLHYLYIQISSIALADLSFIVMVDSFTVYFEMQPWRLGAAFCKTWMILDVALPAVSLIALLLLNVDRVLYTYKNEFYYCLMRRPLSRLAVILSPWVVSSTVVCSLWLGFPEVQPQDGLCVYGITEEANSASSWLMVFLPSLLIFVLIIFIFIAFIGEMPPVSNMTSVTMTSDRDTERARQARRMLQAGDIPHRQNSISGTNNTMVYTKNKNLNVPTHEPNGSTEIRLAASSNQTLQDTQYSLLTPIGVMMSSCDNARTHRRFISALLAVDFFSLAITLPYSAFSLVSPVCTDTESCESLRSLFQTLSWMRSSAACVRPLLFFLLTDIWTSTKRSCIRCYTNQDENLSDYSVRGRPQSSHLQLKEFHQRNSDHGNGAGTDCAMEISGNKPFGGFARTNAFATIDEISDVGGYLSPETSVTMTNCFTATPPSSPPAQKQGQSGVTRDEDNLTMPIENKPTISTHWLHTNTAATVI